MKPLTHLNGGVVGVYRFHCAHRWCQPNRGGGGGYEQNCLFGPGKYETGRRGRGHGARSLLLPLRRLESTSWDVPGRRRRRLVFRSKRERCQDVFDAALKIDFGSSCERAEESNGAPMRAPDSFLRPTARVLLPTPRSEVSCRRSLYLSLLRHRTGLQGPQRLSLSPAPGLRQEAGQFLVPSLRFHQLFVLVRGVGWGVDRVGRAYAGSLVQLVQLVSSGINFDIENALSVASVSVLRFSLRKVFVKRQ